MGLIDLIKDLNEKEKKSLEAYFNPIHNDWNIKETIGAWKS